jgi:hypothetical protein
MEDNLQVQEAMKVEALLQEALVVVILLQEVMEVALAVVVKVAEEALVVVEDNL